MTQPEYIAQPDDADFEMRVNDLLEAVRNGRTITMADGHVGQEAIRRLRRQIELAKATTEQDSEERYAAFRALVGPEIPLTPQQLAEGYRVIGWEAGTKFDRKTAPWAVWTDDDLVSGDPRSTNHLNPRQSTGEMIAEFRKAYGQEHPDRPTVVPVEEASEMLNWIVFGTYDPETGEKTDPSEFEELLLALADNDIVGIADAVADTVYLWYQFAARHGIDLDKVLREVHRSNMSKLGEDGKPVYYPNSTKVAKGPNYSKADIDGALELTWNEEGGVWE